MRFLTLIEVLELHRSVIDRTFISLSEYFGSRFGSCLKTSLDDQQSREVNCDGYLVRPVMQEVYSISACCLAASLAGFNFTIL
jgi:hypothetical protein